MKSWVSRERDTISPGCGGFLRPNFSHMLAVLLNDCHGAVIDPEKAFNPFKLLLKRRL
jgi:hypothetical protein